MSLLRQRMMEDMTLKGLSPLTQKSYVVQVSNFAKYYNQSPENLGEEDIRKYFLYLRNEKQASDTILQQSHYGIKFLYTVTLKRSWQNLEHLRSKKRKRLPIILSKEEIKNIINSIGNLKHRTVITTIYSAGLRIGEALRLRITDIDSNRMLIRIEQGKGQKDRYVMLAKNTLTLCYFPH